VQLLAEINVVILENGDGKSRSRILREERKSFVHGFISVGSWVGVKKVEPRKDTESLLGVGVGWSLERKSFVHGLHGLHGFFWRGLEWGGKD
jgi:hypothetical protein